MSCGQRSDWTRALRHDRALGDELRAAQAEERNKFGLWTQSLWRKQFDEAECALAEAAYDDAHRRCALAEAQTNDHRRCALAHDDGQSTPSSIPSSAGALQAVLSPKTTKATTCSGTMCLNGAALLRHNDMIEHEVMMRARR